MPRFTLALKWAFKGGLKVKVKGGLRLRLRPPPPGKSLPFTLALKAGLKGGLRSKVPHGARQCLRQAGNLALSCLGAVLGILDVLPVVFQLLRHV